jgi:hypothetical protein
MKDAGRIEVIRERNANYHVFAFIDGKRPPDELITASLDQATLPAPETNQTTKTAAKGDSKSRTPNKTKANPKLRTNSSKSRAKKRG